MAQQHITRLSDDLDPKLEADETVSFAYRGDMYEIDLCDENAMRFDAAVAPFIGGARTINKSRRAAAAGVDKTRNESVRAWASENGFEVGDRGRISAEIIAAYEAAAVDVDSLSV